MGLYNIETQELIFLLDTIGTLAFAISGTLAAMDKRFDVFGAFVIAFVTSLGGGSVRDILIGNHPVGWMTNDFTLTIITVCVITTFYFGRILQKARHTLFLFDAIGLGVFTIIGIEKALQHDLPLHICLMMGVISPVFGGVVRDTLCNEVPLIFRQEIYATACLFGGCLYLLGSYLNLNENAVLLFTVSSVVAFRLIAVKYKLKLPVPTAHH